MSNWVTVTKKPTKELTENIKINHTCKNKHNYNNQNNLEINYSGLSFKEIINIFEDEYGNYIEDEINNVCRHNKIYSDLLRNINNCDIESFFYDYINKEESIPQKYKQNSVENQDTEIYSDDDF